MSNPRQRLMAALAVLKSEECAAAAVMDAQANAAPDDTTRLRLRTFAAFARSHASRNAARLAERKCKLGLAPSPDQPSAAPLPAVMLAQAAAARSRARRYDAAATLARDVSDYSTAWVCNLNAAEDRDRADECEQLAERPADVAATGTTP